LEKRFIDNSKLSLISTIYKSPGHAKLFQSSVVVTWQRIYNSLTVATAHIKSSFHSCTSMSTKLSLFRSHHQPSVNSEILNPILCYNCQLSRCHLFQSSSSAESQLSTANSQLTLSNELFFITTLQGPNRKHCSQISLLLLAYLLLRKTDYRAVA
jgi:hypothetical protein